jgi:hypothetical protein
MLVPIPIVCFIATFVTDIVFWQTATMQVGEHVRLASRDRPHFLRDCRSGRPDRRF